MLHIFSSPQLSLGAWNWWYWCYHWDKENCIGFSSSKLGLKTLKIAGYSHVHILQFAHRSLNTVILSEPGEVHKLLSRSTFPNLMSLLRIETLSHILDIFFLGNLSLLRSLMFCLSSVAHFTWDCGNHWGGCLVTSAQSKQRSRSR